MTGREHDAQRDRVRESELRIGGNPTERRNAYPLIPRRPMTPDVAASAFTAAAAVAISGHEHAGARA